MTIKELVERLSIIKDQDQELKITIETDVNDVNWVKDKVVKEGKLDIEHIDAGFLRVLRIW